MMYREFIERTRFGETYMTYDDYTDYIEPIYMNGTDNKDKFCKKFYKLHNDIVNRAVELMISGKTASELEDYVFNDNTNVMSDVYNTHDLIKKGFLKKLKEFYK